MSRRRDEPGWARASALAHAQRSALVEAWVANEAARARALERGLRDLAGCAAAVAGDVPACGSGRLPVVAARATAGRALLQRFDELRVDLERHRDRVVEQHRVAVQQLGAIRVEQALLDRVVERRLQARARLIQRALDNEPDDR